MKASKAGVSRSDRPGNGSGELATVYGFEESTTFQQKSQSYSYAHPLYTYETWFHASCSAAGFGRY